MSAALKPPSPVAILAANLASHGFACFPCLESKAPACPNGFKGASTDPAAVHALWHRYPGALIGVATGSASNLTVLDLDLQHASADDWHAEHCPRLDGHRTHRTRSGGLHVLFQHREGVRNRAGLRDVRGTRCTGVDVRGEGGYIIWWPAGGLDVLHRARPQPMPAWLVELAMPAPPPKADLAKVERGIEQAERYVRAAVRASICNVATAPEGRRNDTLNGETFALARFITDGHLTTGQVAEAMAAAGLQAGLAMPEIEKTIMSALRARGGAV